MLRTRFRTRARFIPALSGGGAFSITNSLRFNRNDSAYLSRTLTTPTSATKWTWSAWVKRGNISSNQMLFTAGVDADDYDYIQLGSSNQLLIYNGVGGSTGGYVYTNAVLGDPSGWYHIVVKFDGSLSSSDRVTVYVNGVAQSLTVSTAWPSGGGYINTANAHAIGVRYRPPSSYDSYFDGYMAEVNFVDGQALTADDFGQIDATRGEWSPKKYSGTYGTNGFYLPFNGNANDDSGNGNNWTENNLASTDYMIDTPTNNFSVLNSIANLAALSEGNLKLTNDVTGSWQSVVDTLGVSSGKWYFEACSPTTLSSPPYALIGITTNSSFGLRTGNNYLGVTSDSWGYLNTGAKYTNSSSSSYGASYTAGDVIGCALDMDAGTVTFYKNNVSQGTAFTGLTGTMFCGISVYAASGTTNNYINFGSDSSFAGLKTRQGNTDDNGIGDFYYTPPAGFLALCENNLPTSGVVASGGTETTIMDGGRYYKVHTFTSSGTFTVSSGGEVEYLIIAGGGGGGGTSGSAYAAGGGGAGGLILSSSTVVDSAYTITVGAGGTGAVASRGANGGDSSAFGVTATGGGGGGYSNNAGGGQINGSNGGSGGGAGFGSSSGSVGVGIAGQGNNGATASSSAAGGGGGAGGNATRPTGGAPFVSSAFTGTSTSYAGGGSGGQGFNTGSTGAGYGGGGGGAKTSYNRAGNSGRSGAVIIRYTV